MKSRDFSLDLMKAFAIFLVVMDHLISGTDGIDNPFRAFIYSCHMPLFFFVSGLLAYKKLDTLKDVGTFLAKKCRLLIPVIVFGLGNVLILHQNIGEFLIWHKFGLWFLWTLFLFFLLYAISSVILIKNNNRFVEVLGFLIPAFVCIYLRKYKDTQIGGIFNCINLYNYVFFVGGVFLKRYDVKKVLLKDAPQCCFLIVYVVGLVTNIPALNIPMKMCGVLFAYMVTKRITEKWEGEKLESWQWSLMKVGQSSLFIYTLHYYFIGGIVHLPTSVHALIYSSACYYLLVYSVIATFIIVSCILISEVLKTNKYVFYVTFGVK